jgi:nicotinate-nucleotide adenylyltransferase
MGLVRSGGGFIPRYACPDAGLAYTLYTLIDAGDAKTFPKTVMPPRSDAPYKQSGGPRHPGIPRQLCLGGSFNPIHDGHLRSAKAAAEARGFDGVLLIPSAQPPHKPDATNLAPAADRLNMTRLAAEFVNAQNPPVRFDVDDLEIRRAGPSYTIDTARDLRRRGWPQVWWLIGADMLNYLPKWHQADQLLHEVDFLVMARPGFQLLWDQLPPHFQKLRDNVVTVPAIDISATDIRRRIREGQSIEGLTPPPVIEYIHAHQLYE